MRIPIVTVLFVLGTFFHCSDIRAQDNKQLKALAEALQEAFKNDSSGQLKAYLSRDFSVGAYSMPGAANLLENILKRYPCESAEVSGQKSKSDRLELTLQVKDQDEPVKTHVYLDEDGKIRYIDLFDQLYGMNRYEPSKELVSVPFEDQDGSIILLVRINDFHRPLRLLFDTGADGMAVSQALADSIGLEVARTQQTSVVGGHMEIKVSTNNTIYLDEFAIDHQSIAIFPQMSRDTDGIIGNSVIKRFITKVDYDEQTFSLHSFGKFDYPKDGFAVPVMLASSIMELPATVHIGNGEPVTGNFFFDTGAGYNAILFRPFVKEHNLLLNGFIPDSVTSTVSMGMSTPVFNGRAHEFSLSKNAVIKDMPVALMGNSPSNKNWNPGGAGSIGVGLLQKFNFIINLMDKEIYFKPVKSKG